MAHHQGLGFVPAEITHPVFGGCLAQLVRRPRTASASAWVWDGDEHQRFVLEDLFFQLLTGEPPFSVRMTAHSFLFNRPPATEALASQHAMVEHWNAKARAHGLGPDAELDATALVACAEWPFDRLPPVPHLLGMVPVVMSVCAQWHLQDSEFRAFAAALVRSLPGEGPEAGKGLAGWQPSRHSALPFIAAYVASRFPGLALRVHKGVSQALFGMLFDPEFRLNLVYSLDLPVRIVDVMAQTAPAARELARVFGMAADNRWSGGRGEPPANPQHAAAAAAPDPDDPFLDAEDDTYADALVPEDEDPDAAHRDEDAAQVLVAGNEDEEADGDSDTEQSSQQAPSDESGDADSD